jgi:hypothetical protein
VVGALAVAAVAAAGSWSKNAIIAAPAPAGQLWG